jgi:spermidine/putrescine transport system substrate-binding protein
MIDNTFERKRLLAQLRDERIARRKLLKAFGSAGLAAAALPLLGRGAFADEAGKQTGPGGLPLARPDKPVTLPLYEDPIKSGLAPETGGTFRVFNYQDYIDKNLLTSFGKLYNVDVELTTFDSMDQCITRLATHGVAPDVSDITPDRLDQCVAGKLIKPINKDYIPNLQANVWPSLHSPFYDVGSQYGVPYTIYKTGIGWRDDKISEDIPNLANPWSIFWNAQKYSGYVGVLDDSRESLSMAMCYRGQYDVNTEDPAQIDSALADLKALIPICNPKINITEYQTLPQGNMWLHQSWSGDLLGAYVFYLPKGDDGSHLRFWGAPKGKGPIQNDTFAICSTTTKPVLAHLFLNYILDKDVAYGNFINFTGYQPPQVSITGDSLLASKAIPQNLKNVILTSDDAGPGSMQEMTLTPKGQALWQSAYARFNSGT